MHTLDLLSLSLNVTYWIHFLAMARGTGHNPKSANQWIIVELARTEAMAENVSEIVAIKRKWKEDTFMAFGVRGPIPFIGQIYLGT